MKRLSLAAAGLVIATVAVAGPPWMSIEVPANPFDQGTRGAFAVVHTYHHEVATPYVVSGTAEGVVNGQRRSMRLDARPTGRGGSYAIHKNWGDEGVWVLRIGVEDVEIGAAIGVGADGEVAFVRVPRGRNGAPRQIARGEVETMLTALAAGRPVPSLASR